ncbi:phospholipase D family protein [Rhizobium sp. FKY42]|uniref:phospholipase D family protein n=1 Tax=Rhizobium sp. FKY42 TaxID=2562310 RepID=UPI0014854642|nr:phospholipase D family protein [Rhizobium sp. FKY42]
MTTRLVDDGWAAELEAALAIENRNFCVISPFLKKLAVQRTLAHAPNPIRVVTRFNLADFADGVSDIAALRNLLAAGAEVRGIRNLHAKAYIFGEKRAMVTSANLTEAALTRNHEFGLVSEDREIIAATKAYFEKLWACGGLNLTVQQLDDWEQTVAQYLAEGAPPNATGRLDDFGATGAGILDLPLSSGAIEAEQAYVKFLGEGNNRVSLSFPVRDEVESALCHWALTYPANKRPTAVKDGALMFISRLTSDPRDIIIFGRAIGMKHVLGRDDASAAEIKARDWKDDWPRYIRVHHAEFVAGTMANGVSLNALMDELGHDAFISTQRNHASGEGNTNPYKAYRQQAAVQLSSQGQKWLTGRLQLALARHGRLPQDELDQIGWPTLPIEWAKN